MKRIRILVLGMCLCLGASMVSAQPAIVDSDSAICYKSKKPKEEKPVVKDYKCTTCGKSLKGATSCKPCLKKFREI